MMTETKKLMKIKFKERKVSHKIETIYFFMFYAVQN